MLGVCNVAVLKCVRKATENLPETEKPATVDILEMDELWHFIKKRAESSGYGLWLTVYKTASRSIPLGTTAFTLGSRGVSPVRRLWEQVQTTFPLVVATDYWQAYPAIIPPELHLVTKAETHTVDGKNAQIRHCLARFKRKTFCYSKYW